MESIMGIVLIGLGASLFREGNYSMLVVFVALMALSGVIPINEWIAAAR